jgi:hypothetical protein
MVQPLSCFAHWMNRGRKPEAKFLDWLMGKNRFLELSIGDKYGIYNKYLPLPIL